MHTVGRVLEDAPRIYSGVSAGLMNLACGKPLACASFPFMQMDFAHGRAVRALAPPPPEQVRPHALHAQVVRPRARNEAAAKAARRGRRKYNHTIALMQS
jgi:hypothetical protein